MVLLLKSVKNSLGFFSSQLYMGLSDGVNTIIFQTFKKIKLGKTFSFDALLSLRA